MEIGNGFQFVCLLAHGQEKLININQITLVREWPSDIKGGGGSEHAQEVNKKKTLCNFFINRWSDANFFVFSRNIICKLFPSILLGPPHKYQMIVLLFANI